MSVDDGSSALSKSKLSAAIPRLQLHRPTGGWGDLRQGYRTVTDDWSPSAPTFTGPTLTQWSRQIEKNDLRTRSSLPVHSRGTELCPLIIDSIPPTAKDHAALVRLKRRRTSQRQTNAMYEFSTGSYMTSFGQ